MTPQLRRATAGSRVTGLLLLLLVPAAAGQAQDAPGAHPRPEIEQARVVGAELRLVVANPGEAATGAAELIVATRADGRLAASTRRALAPLAPGTRREVRVTISLWGARQPALLEHLARGCCTTRAWIAPDGPAVELVHPPASGVGSP